MISTTDRHTIRSGRAAMLLAATAWSTAGLAQRELDATPATQVAGRALFAFLALLAVVAVTERSGIVSSFRSLGRDGLVIAVFLAISSGTFLLALNYTSVANVLFLQASAPIMAALLGWAILSERISRRTWIAMVMAAFGVGAMVVGSFHAGALAVILPVIMTFSFAVVIVMTRYRRDVSMMPATCASQALVIVAVAPFASFGSATASDWRIFAALGIFQMGIGLAFLTVGARLLPAAEVALLSLLEVVLGPLWVWLAYAERPSTSSLVGGAIVTAAIVVQATAREAPLPLPERRPAVVPESG
jgi:drug/metabolite transporter (DMT)-like permease